MIANRSSRRRKDNSANMSQDAKDAAEAIKESRRSTLGMSMTEIADMEAKRITELRAEIKELEEQVNKLEFDTDEEEAERERELKKDSERFIPDK